jgi:hypothetical protein
MSQSSSARDFTAAATTDRYAEEASAATGPSVDRIFSSRMKTIPRMKKNSLIRGYILSSLPNEE